MDAGLLEELALLTSMAGSVLADSGEGETPMWPLPIKEACAAAELQGLQDPAFGLSQALLGVLSLVLREQVRSRVLGAACPSSLSISLPLSCTFSSHPLSCTSPPPSSLLTRSARSSALVCSRSLPPPSPGGWIPT